jgi:serine/threonine protein kinase
VRGAVPPTHREGSDFAAKMVPPTVTDPVVSESGSTGVWIPSSLQGQYRIIRGLGASGGEGDLALVQKESADGQPNALRVLKLYREGIEIRPEALTRLQAVDKAHVVRLLDHGRDGKRWYEVQEYIAGGNLADMAAAEAPLEATRLHEIIRELAQAIGAIHDADVFHKDIKPANVLVRATRPLDLVLGDFGLAIAADLSKHFVSSSKTSHYAAPEVFLNYYTKKSDWWSFGMLAAELALGTHPLQGLSELAVGHHISERQIDLERVQDPRVKLLCRGLLLPKQADRWGWEEVSAWLDGDDPAVKSWASDPLKIEGFEFGGIVYKDPPELARAFGRKWTDAARQVRGGPRQERNLESFLEQFSTAQRVASLLDEWKSGTVVADQRVAQLLVALDPDLPFAVFREADVTPGGLQNLAGEVVQDGTDSRFHETLTDLYRHRILSIYSGVERHRELGDIDERWHKTFEQARKTLENVGRPPTTDLEALLLGRALLSALSLNVARKNRIRARIVMVLFSRRCRWIQPLRGQLARPGVALALVALEGPMRTSGGRSSQRVGSTAAPSSRDYRNEARIRLRAGAVAVPMVALMSYSSAILGSLVAGADPLADGTLIGAAAGVRAVAWLPALALASLALILVAGRQRWAILVTFSLAAVSSATGWGRLDGWPGVRDAIVIPSGIATALADWGGQIASNSVVTAVTLLVVALTLSLVVSSMIAQPSRTGSPRFGPDHPHTRRQQVLMVLILFAGFAYMSLPMINRIADSPDLPVGVVNVSTGLVVRTEPSSASSRMASLEPQRSFEIRCQTQGEQVAGPNGPTTLWNQLADGGYVSDAYVLRQDGVAPPTC